MKTFPGTEISSRNTPVYNSSIADVTLPKTLYTRSGDYTGYEPLSFDDNVRKQDSHQVHYGLDYPDCRLPQQPESVQAQGRNSENLAAEMSDRESEKNDKSAYANESIDQGYVDQGYENVSPDNKRIELKSALELPQEELTVNPIAEKDKHFQYYQNHLCHEKGWYPAAYSIEDVSILIDLGLFS